MGLQLEEAISVLDRTPQLLRIWLAGLPESLVLDDEGADTFSARDVVAHLVQGEQDDWMPRVRRILTHGEERAFEPFDRFAFRERFAEQALTELLDRFEVLRGESLLALGALRLVPEDLDQTGMHPDLGRVTLGELLSTWVVHDLAHLGQIARVLAKHLADEVGPWRAYLGILDR